jgi:hypothetical protein
MTLLEDLRPPAIERTLDLVRAELAAAGLLSGLRVDALVRVVAARLDELATEAATLGAHAISVAVHADFDAVAVEILAGPSRDWIQLT